MANADIFLMERDHRRRVKDTLTRYGVTVGGIGVLFALLLIFFYLLYVITPVFSRAEVSSKSTFSLAFDNQPAAVGLDEYGDLAYRFSEDGEFSVIRFEGDAGKVIHQEMLAENVSSFSRAISSSGWYAYGLTTGDIAIFKPEFSLSYPGNQRLVNVSLRKGMTAESLRLDPEGQAIQQLAISFGDKKAVFVGQTDDKRVVAMQLSQENTLMNGESQWQRHLFSLPKAPKEITDWVITPDGQFLYLLSHSDLYVVRIEEYQFVVRDIIDVSEGKSNHQAVDLELLAGAHSLLITHQDNRISQWFDVMKDGKRVLQRVRDVELSNQNVVSVIPEYYRKGFFTLYENGQLDGFYTTSENQLFSRSLTEKMPSIAAISPRADQLLLISGDEWQRFDVKNEHPEITFSSLWQQVWYEGYPEPQYVWQSTAASDDFEPKLSLVPIVFGTLKAAAYALFFAVPIAVAGAIYTAYFMSSTMRQYVKPTIEIMEALPTVILGFLAGLWLAPIVEQYLPAIFSMVLIMPVAVLLMGLLWQRLPDALLYRLPNGWHPLLLIPVVLLVGYLSFVFSGRVEEWFFDGDVRLFLTENGIGFDQRNSLVVGIAMGFAVVPTIFSIAEDAIFSVPRHLSDGSLALGATQWQTLTKVVLLTASPGIFSAIMMGLGRAVGETMIVLMATGNTPILDWNIFEGLRSLSANIAVEMPESEVGSSHYRVLFLAAFVLFVVTFLFNTLAEYVRQRLRDKYSSL
ncbi:ABC transporter permease subunit [Vibrio sp. Of7-15]|uniref:ABC transporter permease subunit n=1 Tax=Vibrio sp. Of7-15 TaxID=2724879 RepID=UPI001EF3A65B|nr:ABC transporter permease subunit [Vibrio sp. Of7-15]MCG7498573.1 ABC transporter permease subunit [Vibrio sp. Of7-15]